MTSPGEIVHELQQAAGLTQGALARRLGVAPSTVGRWKRGALPRAAMARRLHQLTGRDDDSHPLRLARLDVGLTQHGLARLLPADPTAVCHWEAGRRTPTRAARARLAELLGQDPGTVDSWFVVAREREHAVPGLVHVRRERGWTQRDVARLLDVPPATVQRLESTGRRLDDEELEQLCAVLELDPSERDLLRRPALRAVVAQGTRAEQLRRARSVSLTLAASRARMSNARLRAMEQGRLPLDLRSARRLAVVYGVPLSTVLAVFGEEMPTGLLPGGWRRLSLSEALTLMRLYSGLRWQDLVRLTGCSESTLRRWHSGQRRPGAAGLRLLETAYGLDVGRLSGLAVGSP